ncbi:hypothetical protein [Thermococcus eurythermalis]|nr:hypothetical protein [Thermococcus eurythermalis]
MVRPWEVALGKFLKPWEENEVVEAALLTGTRNRERRGFDNSCP